jgi:hypothetical protein
MRFVRFVCFFLVIFSSSMLLAQSQTPINSTAERKVSSGLSQPDPKTQGKILESYGKLPLSFEANQGQTDSRVKFLSRGSGYTLFLTGEEAVFSLRRSKADGKALPASPQLQPTVLPTANAVLRMKLVKANPAARVIGADELPAKSNYFIGSDPKKWRSNVANYAKVKYEGIYSGIDLVYYGTQRELEYDFVVAPGADPHRIQFEVRGAKHLRRDEQGDLVIQTNVVPWNPAHQQDRGGWPIPPNEQLPEQPQPRRKLHYHRQVPSHYQGRIPRRSQRDGQRTRQPTESASDGDRYLCATCSHKAKLRHSAGRHQESCQENYADEQGQRNG